MSVGRIATRVVATASPSESVLDVARRMAESNVGCVVVVDGNQEAVGIVTDRDIVTRAVAKELDARGQADPRRGGLGGDPELRAAALPSHWR